MGSSGRWFFNLSAWLVKAVGIGGGVVLLVVAATGVFDR